MPIRAAVTVELAAVIVTLGVQAWRQNTGLRFVTGTATCLVLANDVFPD
ncbi:MAG TPA: hypothetical protein VFR67_27795 [Pilimelia sp.]|nr:hypothetical protein [Pilimelia sp.]